jgi:CRISPR-associated endonuclease/helicase Cas3
MDKLIKRRDVGRVIFRPQTWIVQTLDSHVGNVARLAEAWDNCRAFQGNIPDLERTRQQVIEAARIHDMAKPARFRLVYKLDPFHRKWKWEYSFSGHRFNAFHDDTYVQMLAQLHHEYSVAGIAQHMARLKLNEATESIAENLPLDLYTLEMCDQIEATVARAALGSEDPEERVFMDFQFRTRAEAEYELEPFAFSKTPVEFTVEYVELPPSQDKRQAVETAADDNKRRVALREVKDWLLEELQTVLLQHKEVRLWPWMK